MVRRPSLLFTTAEVDCLLGRRARKLKAQRTSRRPEVELLEDRSLLSANPWTPLLNQAPDFAGTMMLLTDGRVMVQGYVPGNDWMTLTPDASGSYVNGTWSTIAPMSTTRLYYASNILPTGKVFVLGGEYSDANYDVNWTNSGEIYNPQSNSWSPIATFPDPSGHFGDDPSMLLSNGKDILTGGGAYEGGITYIYHSDTNTWSGPISKIYNDPVEPAIDSSDEETWVKLPDGKVLTYDLFKSTPFFDSSINYLNPGGSYAEVFDPKAGTWSSISPSDGTAHGFIPQLSSVYTGFELGPMLLLQDGRVLTLGATGHTALYNPSTNTWSAGPDIIDNNNMLFGADDMPAAELPNGHVIFFADNVPQTGYGNSAPTEAFDFNPSNNTIAQIQVPDPQLQGSPGYPTRLLVLPNGQVLFDDSDTHLWVYTPVTSAATRYQPVVNNVTFGNGAFTLTGKQLNGPSSGSSYGDDVESDENYPIVRLTRVGTGEVYYARTYNWSNTGVATGSTSETVNFTLPTGMMPGRYAMVESGAGVLSAQLLITITPNEIPAFPNLSAGTPSVSAGSTITDPGAIIARVGTGNGMAGVSLAAMTANSQVLSFKTLASETPAPQATATEVTSDVYQNASSLAQVPATAVTNYLDLTKREMLTDDLFAMDLDWVTGRL
jgi:hypothetical protein